MEFFVIIITEDENIKDFEFAKRIFELRKSSNMSQKKLAEELGLTNKAISKWENGGAKPTIEQLIKLSNLFNITVDELIKPNNNENKKIYKIVLTGGPCSGKTTAMSYLQETFTKKGYMVLVVPETASELILGGVAPWTIDSNYNFEFYIMQLQLEKEKLYEEAAKHIDNYNKVLIICDRGIMDCKPYMTDYEFDKCLKDLHTNSISLRDNYDAVFHLVTAAKGAKDFYTTENNKARFESLEEAVIKDDNTINAWTGHPHLRVIDNSTDFAGKMHRLKGEILNFLGEDVPFEIERKFLIEYPNIEQLEKLPNCQKIDIVQTYLKSKNGLEIRIRQRGQNGNFAYAKTIKQKVTNIKRLETETRITKDEYLRLLLEADTNKRQIIKTRYCLMHNNQYFEIDVYPFWNDKAIMEIELRDEKQKINFPKMFKIIKEVTDDENYSNYNLASQKGV